MVKNAIKHTDYGEIGINVCYQVQNAQLRVEVSDTGLGISQERSSMIVSRFGKLLGTSNVNNDSKGLGLQIVHQIAA